MLSREQVTGQRREFHLASGVEETAAAHLLQPYLAQHQVQSATPQFAPFYSPQLFQRPDFGRSPNRRTRRSRLREDQLGWPVVRRTANVARSPKDEYRLSGNYLGILEEICQAVTVTIGAEAASMEFKVPGLCAIIRAEASAYSAYAPVNCSFVAPYTSSPSLNPETCAPIASTIPDSSEPRMRGKGWSSILPSRMRASQLPTPAAFYAD